MAKTLYTVDVSDGIMEAFTLLGVFSQWNQAFSFAEKQAVEFNGPSSHVRLVEWTNNTESTTVRRWEAGQEI